MQPLNLTPAQLEHLNKHGTLLVWLPMIKQIGKDFFLCSQGKSSVTFRQHGSRGNKCNIRRPHRLGDRVRCETTFTKETRPDWLLHGRSAIYYATLTTTPEPVRLGDVTEQQAKAAGVCQAPYIMLDEIDFEPAKLYRQRLMRQHPGITPGSWGWVFTIRKEN